MNHLVKEQHFAYKLRQHLNRGLHELPNETRLRLEDGRRRALARQKVAVRHSVFAGVAGFLLQQADNLRLRQVGLALLVALGIGTYTFWHAEQSIAELEVIDSALLSDELPVAAFTDKGFAAWLTSSASQ
ncbi:DUF3619 family protein [Accumulibacter sp.]|jgi:hypothetical protein|uniref:DUF3619 family protein n=1 Tax=Accumulibacter sp. TaxID=2053492 RepID=UPI001ACE34C7|nr:DUF3619 family protein [Accumulibacter sp.]MBN8453543.1 DUF3619 family protein [Accumulibacter sp.]MBO3708131.1 DUF3619 family protein [Candidatus Accumulibacter conexus]